MPSQDFSDIQAFWSGPFMSHSGFSKMNREIVWRLVDRGAKIRIETAGEKMETDQSTAFVFNELMGTQVRTGSPRVYGMTMPTLMDNQGPRILYTMVETSGGVHKDYAEKASLSTEIWVPSECLKRSLLPHPMYATRREHQRFPS
jgi:hypothetical protein